MSFHRPFLEAESCVRRLGLDMVLKMLATSLTQMLSQLKELCTFSTSQVQKPWLRIRLEPRVSAVQGAQRAGTAGPDVIMLRGLKFLLAGKRHDSLTPVVTQNNNVDSSTLKVTSYFQKGFVGGCCGAMFGCHGCVAHWNAMAISSGYRRRSCRRSRSCSSHSCSCV